jgi:hypothetical protein
MRVRRKDTKAVMTIYLNHSQPTERERGNGIYTEERQDLGMAQLGEGKLGRGLELINLLQQSLGVVGTVVLHDLRRVAVVDKDDVLTELSSHSLI